MNKDLHDIDEVFVQAFADQEPMSQARLWERLEARLDKDDAIAYRRKFIGAKRAVVTLVFLLLSIVLYETGMQNNGASGSRNHITTITTGFKTGKPAAAKLTPRIEGISPKQKAAAVHFSSSNAHGDRRTISNSRPFQETADGMSARLLPVTIERILQASLPAYPSTTAPAFTGPHIAVDVKNNSATPVPAKQPSKQKHFTPYWTMGLTGFNDWTEYNLDNDVRDRGPGNNDERGEIKQRENHEPSWSLSLSVARQLSAHWSIRSGLSFSNINISIDPHTIYATTAPSGNIAYKYNLSSGYAYLLPSFAPAPASGDSIETVMARHNLQYLSVPLAAGYTVRLKKFSVTGTVGLTANFLLHAKLQTGLTDAQNTQLVNVYRLQGTKEFYAGLNAGAILGYQVSKKLSINLEPFFRTALTPFTQSNVVKTYPFSFGLGLGASFRL